MRVSELFESSQDDEPEFTKRAEHNDGDINRAERIALGMYKSGIDGIRKMMDNGEAADLILYKKSDECTISAVEFGWMIGVLKSDPNVEQHTKKMRKYITQIRKAVDVLNRLPRLSSKSELGSRANLQGFIKDEKAKAELHIENFFQKYQYRHDCEPDPDKALIFSEAEYQKLDLSVKAQMMSVKSYGGYTWYIYKRDVDRSPVKEYLKWQRIFDNACRKLAQISDEFSKNNPFADDDTD